MVDEVTSSISVLEDLDEQFDLQPNPVGDELWVISFDESIRNYQVQIIDSNGRLLHAQRMNGSDQNRIDVAALTSGLYFVNIVTEKGPTTKKILVR